MGGAAARVCLINLSGRLAVRVDLDARVGVQVGVGLVVSIIIAHLYRGKLSLLESCGGEHSSLLCCREHGASEAV